MGLKEDFIDQYYEERGTAFAWAVNQIPGLF